MISIKLIFLIYLFSYIFSVLIGYILGKFTKIKVSSVRAIIIKLYDPFTVKLKNKIHKNFTNNIKKQKREVIFLTIFFNNLIFGALITRTLYGIIFFYPYLLTLAGGFNQGIVLSRINFINPLLLLEFLAYLIAGTAGTYIGLHLILSFIHNINLFLIIITSLSLYPYYIIPILIIHTLIEVRLITMFKIPEGIEMDISTTREEILKKLDSSSRD